MKGKRHINYLQGVASIFEIWPILVRWPVINYSARLTNDETFLSDYNAIKRDWEAVGGDIRQAMELFQQQSDEEVAAGMMDRENKEYGAGRQLGTDRAP